jgi:hypothetical protein
MIRAVGVRLEPCPEDRIMEECELKPRYEIVRVIDQQYLIDSESYERTFAVTPSGGLQPGCYIVVWGEDARTLNYNDDPQYLGPFISRVHAEAALREARIDRLAEQRTI